MTPVVLIREMVVQMARIGSIVALIHSHYTFTYQFRAMTVDPPVRMARIRAGTPCRPPEPEIDGAGSPVHPIPPGRSGGTNRDRDALRHRGITGRLVT